MRVGLIVAKPGYFDRVTDSEPVPVEDEADTPREPPLPDPKPGPEGVPKDEDPGPDA